jgi:predicted Zn-dependent protease
MPSLLPTGCSVNPATGRSEVVLVTPEKEKEIGRQESARVDAEIGLLDDPQLVAYVEAVGQRVARHSPRKDVSYSFHVLDMEEPNAFALPGGYVYVSRGMLAIANSEDEIANVIGHEIAHVAARHAAQRQTRAAGVGLLGIGGAILGAILGAPGELLNAPQVMGSGLLAAYGRDQEREADRLGQEMAASAGVDPRGMARFLRTLDNTARLRHGASRRPSFWDTHPSTPERVASATTRGDSLRWTPRPGVAAQRGDFLTRLDGLLLGLNPAEGVFRDDRFLHVDLDLSLRFPEGWTTANSRRAVEAVSPRRDASTRAAARTRSGRRRLCWNSSRGRLRSG